ncbi:N-acetylmuramoyl-L-alanine amidase [Thermolongibacillus altinsuensis]|uniref:N-acetylmuramoyl-L-alanine amidase n=1 Tax=Thermolongibacillus altinsuensis TaxID=575256 RepID=UPI00242A2E29|nr:N-acetylmuramoyl-L-alanine amidase [Thermolongibacillus altinsuensis]GMB09153.1 amidase [Thermolongibacillus altinsuensis]
MVGKKLLICLNIVLLAFFSGVYSAFANTEMKQGERFVDVPDNHWAKSEIEYLAARNIVTGYDQGSVAEFRPNNPVTRAEAAKMIVIALGQKEADASSLPFTDVDSNHWARGWIARAMQLGFMTGYDNQTFRPNEVLSRAEMSKVLVEAFSLASKDASAESVPVFKDTSGHWALAYINRLYYYGIAVGRNDQFFPNDSISRAEFSVLLTRTINEQFRLPLPELVYNKAKTNVQGIVTAATLNVRSQPSATAPLVGKLRKGQIVNVYSINGFWAKILYNNQLAYVHKTYLKLRNVTGSPVQGRIIVVDAGHGGKDPGTIGAGTTEKVITLAVAKKLKEKLQKAGATVIMTRETDVYPTLEDRVNIAKSKYAEMFISIHVNSAAKTSAKGTEVFYDTSKNANGEESKKLAQFIQQEIVKRASMVDRGVEDYDFYVLRNNNITSVLIELGFITNPDDAKKLTSPQYQNIYAEAIYQGIIKYYTSQ